MNKDKLLRARMGQLYCAGGYSVSHVSYLCRKERRAWDWIRGKDGRKQDVEITLNTFLSLHGVPKTKPDNNVFTHFYAQRGARGEVSIYPKTPDTQPLELSRALAKGPAWLNGDPAIKQNHSAERALIVLCVAYLRSQPRAQQDLSHE